MPTYYLLRNTFFDEKKHYLFHGVIYNSQKKKVENVFDDGITHADLGPPFTIILDESDSLLKNRTLTDRVSTFAVEAGLLLLVSQAAQEVFSQSASGDVAFYDVHIKASNFDLEGYKIVKVIDKIDCVDLDASEVDYDEDFDSIDSAESLVLDEQKIPPGKQIFLLGKRETGVIVVHEDLKNTIEQKGLTGFQFHTLEEAYMVVN